MVRAGGKDADAEVLFTLREQVAIEQNLFWATGGRLAAIDGVLFPLFGARVVEIFTAADGHALVGLFDAGHHLAIKLVLQLFSGCHHGGHISILVRQILDDFGLVLVAQPMVVIYADIAVQLHGFGVKPRYGL